MWTKADIPAEDNCRIDFLITGAPRDWASIGRIMESLQDAGIQRFALHWRAESGHEPDDESDDDDVLTPAAASSHTEDARIPSRGSLKAAIEGSAIELNERIRSDADARLHTTSSLPGHLTGFANVLVDNGPDGKNYREAYARSLGPVPEERRRVAGVRRATKPSSK